MTDYLIWKAELDMNRIGEIQVLPLPRKSILLSIGEQSGQLMIWYQFPEAFRTEARVDHKFLIAFTGMPITLSNSLMHVFKGTVQIGGFVYHVFALHGES